MKGNKSNISKYNYQPFVCSKSAEKVSQCFAEWLSFSDYKFSLINCIWQNRLTGEVVEFSYIYNMYLNSMATHENKIMLLKYNKDEQQ